MNKQTLSALEESISHWDRICQGTERPGGTNACALCNTFALGSLGDCWDCPIGSETGVEGCGNTPYYNDCVPCFDSLGSDFDSPEERMIETSIPESWELKKVDTLAYAEACEKELIFLLSLLPEGHQWRGQI